MRLKSSQRKILKFFALFCLTTIIFLSALAFYLPYWGRKETARTQAFFYDRTPDVISVFTGDKDRIQHAYTLAKEMPGSQLLITGVHNNNSLKTIANHQIKSHSAEQLIRDYSHLIELDYSAKNTVENVLSTLIYVRQNPTIEQMIIVSSDYHIARIQYIISRFIKKNHPIQVRFHFSPVSTSAKKWANIKRYYREVFSFLKALIFFAFWN